MIVYTSVNIVAIVARSDSEATMGDARRRGRQSVPRCTQSPSRVLRATAMLLYGPARLPDQARARGDGSQRPAAP
eukprot:3548214-Pleurochrysis_carterae.AAC.2